MLNNQKGATLIVVLILLVALTVIGTLAVRQSIVALSIATNGQAQQLLTQNSDAAIFNIEDPDAYDDYTRATGLFGLISSKSQQGKELVFCYRGSSTRFFNKAQSSIIFNEGNTVINNSEGTAGYCRVGGTNNFFTSNRRAVLTQVSLVSRAIDDETDNVKPFQYSVRGQDNAFAKSGDPERIIVNAISLMPALSTATDAEINACLSNHLSTTAVSGQTVTTCLTALNVPFVTHVSEYIRYQKFNAGVKG
jgi:hypothetical protein